MQDELHGIIGDEELVTAELEDPRGGLTEYRDEKASEPCFDRDAVLVQQTLNELALAALIQGDFGCSCAWVCRRISSVVL